MKQCQWVLIACAILLSSSLLLGCNRIRSEVKIAVILGPDYIPGAQLAAEEINSRGGIKGRRLVLDIDRSGASNDATLALNSAMRFSKTPDIVAVVGHGTSSASLPAAQVYNEAGVAQIVPMATSPVLAHAGPWTFRLCIDDMQQGKLLADFVFDALKKKKVFIFQVSDDYGKGLNYFFRTRFSERGGTVLYQAIYTEERPHFQPYLELVQKLEPELIFLAGRIEEGLQLRREMESFGINVPVIGGDALYVAPKIKQEKSYSEGLMLTLFFHPAFEGAVVDAFVNNFQKQFRFTPDARAALAYDAVYLLKAAIEKSGTSREAIRQGLSTIGSKRTPFHGVTGLIFFHGNGVSVDTLHIGMVKNGEVLLVREYISEVAQ